MQIEERTYYEEEQKMEANWVLMFIVITSISSLTIAGTVLYNEHKQWLEIGLVTGIILAVDALVIFIFKKMKLELALSKKGFHYKMIPGGKNNQVVDWNEVVALQIRKSPATGYGKKIKWKYGEVYAMNLKSGVELSLKSGKKKFFSLKDAEEFKKHFKKLELNLKIE